MGHCRLGLMHLPLQDKEARVAALNRGLTQVVDHVKDIKKDLAEQKTVNSELKCEQAEMSVEMDKLRDSIKSADKVCLFSIPYSECSHASIGWCCLDEVAATDGHCV